MDKRVTQMQTQLAEPDQAIEQLVMNLLAEVPDHPTSVPEPVSEATPTGVQSPAPEPALNIAVAAPISEAKEAQPTPGEAPVKRLRPDWAQGELKVLLFRVGEQRMGVPLICLNSIAKLEQQARPMQLPAQPAWHKGVLDYRAKKLVLVDLVARLQLRSCPTDAQFVLVIGQDSHGLLCDAIEEPVSVPADDINWRDARDTRHWMLGMLPEHMCVLIDPEAIASELQDKTGTNRAL